MLKDFIQIRKKLYATSISKSEIVGDIDLKIDEITILKKLSDARCMDNFVITDNNQNIHIDNISTGGKYRITLHPNELKDELYFETFEDLIKSKSQAYPTVPYFVFSLDFDSTQHNQPIEIQNYVTFTKLITFLISISDYQKRNELVFFQAKKLIITTDYNSNDLVALHNFDGLITHIQDSADKEERQIIFINEMMASLSKINEIKNRFKFLVTNFSEITSNYHNSHKLYLEKYSYQKFKSEIDNEIIDYSKKIQAVINDAQSKLVAIPAAFIFIIGQFDLKGEKIYYNFALIFTAFVFSILLDVLINNQFSALDFVKDDINRFKTSVDENKIILLGDEFNKVFKKIDVLHSRQKCNLNIIRFLVWLTPIFAIFLLILSLTNNTLICFLRTIFSKF